MFAGIMPQESLVGHKDYSSTYFRSNGIKTFDITVNGNSVSGYPLTIQNEDRKCVTAISQTDDS